MTPSNTGGSCSLTIGLNIGFAYGDFEVSLKHVCGWACTWLTLHKSKSSLKNSVVSNCDGVKSTQGGKNGHALL